MFQNSGVTGTRDNFNDEQNGQGKGKNRMSNINAEEFAAMGLRTGQKRPRRDNEAATPIKKNKKKWNRNNQ